MRSRTTGLIAAGVLALGPAASASTAANAAIPLHAANLAHTTRAPQGMEMRPAAGSRLLYDQDNDRSEDIVTPSADYPQKATKDYDSQVADRFTVPKGSTWAVTEAVAIGLYTHSSANPSTGGPATSENVYFYKNTVTTKKRDIPGTPVGTEQTVKGYDYSGLFVIPKITGVTLPAGTYWISVQANMSSRKAGEWDWIERASPTAARSVWENPGGGYGKPCASWAKDCTGPSVMFALYGSNKG